MQPNDSRLNFADLWKGLASLRDAQEPLLDYLDHKNIHPDTLARYGNALSIEVSEFINEMPWKVWKPGQSVDRAKMTEEFADILAFLGVWINLLGCFGITAGDLAQAYALKREKNMARFRGESQELGYDGVSPVGVVRPDHDDV